MPGKIKVKVVAGRNLPVMDRASDTTDAFVEIKFGNVTHKTDVCRKTLNPHWSSTEWYRFEVDESELQDEPLQLRLMDHDTYSANDAIGKVVISLAPLLAREANNAKSAGPPGAVLSGWIPVFDTMHGIRGELNVIVKVELFSDFNKYKTSSCGVQFFHCATIPAGYKTTAIHGFVEELVVNDDPEYQWIDKIRTPRASNEARQVAFIKLSNQVQRLVGLKAAELGANAVVGYQQDFDLEGEAGVVARAIGTAVSLIPPPTPMHSIHIPPCTQQQLKKYLDILATDDETVVDLNQYFRHHQHELQRLLNIMNPKTPTLLDDPENIEDDDKYDFTKQSSVKNFTGWYQDEDVSQKSLKHISEDQTELNKLLRGNEGSDSDSAGPLKKIKKLKTNFTKRLGSLRSRKTDKQDDNVSLQSNSSDNSRISLSELRNEFKKFKRLKKPKFRKSFTNNEDEGIGMASILARSVIHVHTSLACIAEKESEHSPCSTMRRTSESEPTINISDDEQKLNKNDEQINQIQPKTNIPEIHTSLRNVNVDEANIMTRERKLSESCPASPTAERSENFLKLPDETGYFGSVSLSGDSSEAYTSSEEDGDDSSDPNAEVEKSVETTSSVVQSVLNKNVDPAFIAHMERKLSLLEGTIPELKESQSHGEFENISEIEMKPNYETSKSSPCIHHNENKDEENQDSKLSVGPSTSSSNKTNTSTTAKLKNNRHFKFHNLFTHKKVSKSMSAPSSPIENTSFIYRSSKRIKRQFSKISKSNLFKSISHYSLNSNKKNQSIKAPLSQPGSSSNVPSKVPSYETVLGSPFLSYADLMSLDKTESEVRKQSFPVSDEPIHSKVKMYIGSEPVSRASISGPSSPYYKDEHFIHDQKTRKDNVIRRPSGLVHTAMETILIDKVQSLLLPTCSEVTQSKEQRFFDDVNEKLEKFEESRNQLRKYNFDQQDNIDSRDTISMSTIKSKISSLPATPCISHGIENKFFDDHHDNVGRVRSKERKDKHESLMQTAMKTMLIDKVQSLIPATSESLIISQTVDLEDTIQAHESTHNKHPITKPSLMHTAMETILIDKVKALLPPSAEPVDTDDENIGMRHHDRETIKEKKEKSPSLFHTALETILIDKAQVLIPPGSQPVTPDCTSINSVDSNMPQIPVYEGKVKDDHCSLLQSAMETILMDKVQSLMPTDSETVSCGGSISSYTPEKVEKLNENSNLLNTAIKTILIEKDQILTPPSSEAVACEVPLISNIVSNVSEKSHDNEKHTSSLFQSAMETILMDKVQTLTTVSDQIMEIKPASDNIMKKSENPVKTEKNNENNFSTQPTLGQFCMDNGKSNSHVTKPIIHVDIVKGRETSYDRCDTSCNENNNEMKIICDTSLENNKAENDSHSTETKLLNANDNRDKRLVRQDSVHSLKDDDTVSQKMSKETSANITVSHRIAQSKPVLQHFHPILSGKPLETIPSLPESSFDHTESLDIDGVEQACHNQTELQCTQCDSETNSASVCGNSHAACDVDRNEREKEKVFEKEKERESPRHARHESYGGREPVVTSQPTQISSFTPSMPLGIHRRSSDSDLSVTPKGGSLNASLGNTGSGGGAILRPSMNSSNIEMLEYPFLTMSDYPPGLIVHLGGTVCARSVKLVDAGGESAARAAWWAELRTELRAHARALRCNAVIAYTESAAICEDVCVLSASGTAAVINLDCDFGNELEAATSLVTNGCKGEEGGETEQCTLAHVPYSPGAGPYRAELSTCGACRKARVPAVLLATCAKPSRLPAYTKAVTVTAVAARIRRAQPSAEPGARDISDQLPFLEYELHKLLLAKLRMQGANALFSLRTQIAIGERCVMALASGTAVRLVALPPPTPPRIKASETDKNALDIQRALWDSFTANKAANGYDIGGSADTILPAAPLPDLEVDDAPALDLCADKDACVLELDEAEDVETAKTLAARRSLMPVFTSDMTPAKGAPPQMFAQVWRGRLVLSSSAAERHVARALDSVAYKLRRLQPCALAAPAFQLELPEDEIQLIVSGSAISLVDPNKPEQNLPESNYNYSNHSSPQQSYNSNYHHGHNSNSDNEDDIFALDEDQLVKTPPLPVENSDDKSLIINGQAPTTVSLTTLGYVSGSRSERRVCALRLLFVRETTAVRELGGLSGFLHTFTCEVLAIVRAYTAALGGNALTSFYITQLMLQDNAHKNQGQCLLSVGGDVVHITY